MITSNHVQKHWKGILSILSCLLVCYSIFLGSCRKDALITDSSAKLEFSTDTIQFDTVFTTLGTVTKRFKVYNRHRQDINISNIYLGNNTSNFRLNIDGIPINSTKDVVVAAKDSMYVFVEATIDPNGNNLPLVIQDSIVFETNGNRQDIDLIAFGQDAHLIFSRGGLDAIDIDNMTNDKPYLFLNSVAVDSAETLTIESGVQLHFMRYARLIVLGTLDVRGTKEEPVVFQGARLEHDYDDVPGQWLGIWLTQGSRGHKIDHAVIKNALLGIQVDTVFNKNEYQLEISNSRVEHMSFAGLYALTSKVLAYNTVFANCGYYTVGLLLGGDYEFYHCSMINDWGTYSIRNTPAVVINNYFSYREEPDEDEIFLYYDLERANFVNCIIYGNQEQEVGIDSSKTDEYQFELFELIL